MSRSATQVSEVLELRTTDRQER